MQVAMGHYFCLVYNAAATAWSMPPILQCMADVGRSSSLMLCRRMMTGQTHYEGNYAFGTFVYPIHATTVQAYMQSPQSGAGI